MRIFTNSRLNPFSRNGLDRKLEEKCNTRVSMPVYLLVQSWDIILGDFIFRLNLT